MFWSEWSCTSRTMLASPLSAICSCGWRAATAATLRWTGATTCTPSSVTSSWKVTSAACPSFETSERPPAPNGVRTSVTCATVATLRATSRIAAANAGLLAVVPEDVIRTVSSGRPS